LPSILSKNKILLYSNLIRCESHRDILLGSIVKKYQIYTVKSSNYDIKCWCYDIHL